MKNQYFGDINDYQKYGILRLLAKELSICVLWMLTPDAKQADKRKIEYLKKPAQYRFHDPKLYDFLKTHVRDHGACSVSTIEKSELLPNTIFMANMLDSERDRKVLFNAIGHTCYDNVNLLFFDPDNGLEVESVCQGNKNLSQYLYYEEVKKIWNWGKSILIAHHLPRGEEATNYIKRIIQKLIDVTFAEDIRAFVAGNVVFFLLVQSYHKKRLDNSCLKVAANWHPLIIVEDFKKKQTDSRFTILADRWYAFELLGDEFRGESVSFSPIRVYSVKPFGDGARRFNLSFFHWKYPSGVQHKIYTLQVIERGKHCIITKSDPAYPRRYIYIHEITPEWCELHMGRRINCDDLQEWLTRNLGGN